MKDTPVGLAIAAVGGRLLVSGIAIARRAKPTLDVALTAASWQVQALRSQDQLHIESVVQALNQAVVSRG